MKRNRRIRFNVSGEIFETYEETLKRFPDSLLGNEKKRRKYFVQDAGDPPHYFFDRNRQCFEAVLFFFQSFGTLRCPQCISFELFVEECEFFQIPEKDIYAMKEMAGVLPELTDATTQCGDASGTLRAKIWNLLENPESSYAAKIFTIFSLAAIAVSILCAILETVIIYDSSSLTENPWAMAELILNTWFLVELVARFITSPSKCDFLVNWLNWVDAIAVIPFFLLLIFLPTAAGSLKFLRIIRLVRVLRLSKLSKQSVRLQVVGRIIATSGPDFQLLIVCLLMLVVLIGSTMYYIEEGSRDTSGETFSSIPNSLYWSMVTVTTVGYGDIVPVSTTGKFVSACFMVFGALTMSLPMLSIVSKFQTYFEKNVEGGYNPDEG